MSDDTLVILIPGGCSFFFLPASSLCLGSLPGLMFLPSDFLAPVPSLCAPASHRINERIRETEEKRDVFQVMLFPPIPYPFKSHARDRKEMREKKNVWSHSMLLSDLPEIAPLPIPPFRCMLHQTDDWQQTHGSRTAVLVILPVQSSPLVSSKNQLFHEICPVLWR